MAFTRFPVGESPHIHFRIPADVLDQYKRQAKEANLTLTALMWAKLGIGVPTDAPRLVPQLPKPLKIEKQAPATEELPPQRISCPHPENRLVKVGRGVFCKACETMIK